MTVFVNPNISSTAGIAYAGGGWSILNTPTLNNLMGTASALPISQRDSAAATLAIASMLGENKITNGSFEAGQTGQNAAMNGWTREGATGVTNNTSLPSAGDKALLLGGWSTGSGAVSQEISTQPGGVYTLTFMAAAIAADQRLVVSLSSRDKTTIKDFHVKEFAVTGRDKKHYTFTFEAPTAFTTVRFWVAGNAGDLAIDDVRLVENKDASAASLSNGDFESGPTGAGKADGWKIEGGAGVGTDPNRSSSGKQHLALGGWTDGAGTVSQETWAAAGAIYALSFDAKGFRVDQTLRVTVVASSTRLAGTVLVDETFRVSSKTFAANTLTFAGIGANVTIRFSAESSSGDCDIDNIKYTQVLGDDEKIFNGDFEEGESGSGAEITGWDLHQGGAATSINASRATDGERFLALGGWTDAGGVVSQSIDTRKGTIYSLSFDASAFRVAQNLNLRLIASDGSVVLSQSLTISDAQAKHYTFTFRATSSTTEVMFTVAASKGDLDLDNVSLTRVGGPKDTWSDEAMGLPTDLFLAGSPELLQKAMLELGADFYDDDTRSLWVADYYDAQGANEQRQFFDEAGYLVRNPDVARAWSSDAVLHYIKYGFSEGRRATTHSLAAINLDADIYIAGSTDLLALAMSQLGAGFADDNRRASWARTFYDTTPGAHDRPLFDEDAYLRLYPDVAQSPDWGMDAIGHFLKFGHKEGRLAPTTTSGLSALDTDEYLASSPSLLAEARQALGAQFNNDLAREIWALKRYAAGGYKRTSNYFNEEAYAADNEDKLSKWNGSLLKHYLLTTPSTPTTNLSVNYILNATPSTRTWDTSDFDEIHQSNGDYFTKGYQFSLLAFRNERPGPAKFDRFQDFFSEMIEQFKHKKIFSIYHSSTWAKRLNSFATSYNNLNNKLIDDTRSLYFANARGNEQIIKSFSQALSFAPLTAYADVKEYISSFVRLINKTSMNNLVLNASSTHKPTRARIDQARFMLQIGAYMEIVGTGEARKRLDAADAVVQLKNGAQTVLRKHKFKVSKLYQENEADSIKYANSRVPQSVLVARMRKLLTTSKQTEQNQYLNEQIRSYGSRWNLVVLRMLALVAKATNPEDMFKALSMIEKSKVSVRLGSGVSMAALTLSTMFYSFKIGTFNTSEGLRLTASSMYLVTSALRIATTSIEIHLIRIANSFTKYSKLDTLNTLAVSTAVQIAKEPHRAANILEMFHLAALTAGTRHSANAMQSYFLTIKKLATILKINKLSAIGSIAASFGDFFTSASQIVDAAAIKSKKPEDILRRQALFEAAAMNTASGLLYLGLNFAIVMGASVAAPTALAIGVAGFVCSILGATLGSWATSLKT